jgi:opacity protein-like surface antigen
LDLGVDDTWGINVHAGYQFYKYIALEANFDWYDSFDIDPLFGDSIQVDIWTLMADLKLMLPVGKFVPYARIGVGYMEAELDAPSGSESDSDMAWNLGAGFDFFFTESLSAGLDGKYVMGTGEVDDINYFTGAIRLTFHF